MATYAEMKDSYWQHVQEGDATMMTKAEYARTKIKRKSIFPAWFR
ncbi:hypothetical protein BH11BAC5_BH11BAC5_20170 [soil metagenome]